MLRFLNRLLSATVTLALAVTGLYAAYALWDDQNLIAEAENVQRDLLRMKPQAKDGEGDPFAQLREMNPDVCAWLTLEGTNVDHPVVRGETNMSYINTNVYGEFALSGSIFLDSRCGTGFDGAYQLLYGHHMADHAMFGDLVLYKEADFLEEHHTGVLTLPEGIYDLDIVACLLIPASDTEIYEPLLWEEDRAALLETLSEKAVTLRQDALDALHEEEETRLLAMSTCSYEFTDARTVVIAAMRQAEET